MYKYTLELKCRSSQLTYYKIFFFNIPEYSDSDVRRTVRTIVRYNAETLGRY